ncbi:hypothetical protein [Vibrio quintilis]|uniref:Uncharacterized protein n=1 Tax=Vibrio quintilis TaxID=1117707 RepID=A0A1M7Z2W7_9VIBR|nr:hypothetical protein [Vibrio quintilis]SHO58996.1 hypothetical protein VQ7734_04772 [Vibrio quintilis]
MTHIILKSTQDLKQLFQSYQDVDHDKTEAFYLQSIYIDEHQFNAMTFYELDFEPYISLAYSVNASCFGIRKSPKRFYLSHINNGGHRVLCTIRPVRLSQLQDIDYLYTLEQDYCRQLEADAIRSDEFEV